MYSIYTSKDHRKVPVAANADEDVGWSEFMLAFIYVFPLVVHSCLEYCYFLSK